MYAALMIDLKKSRAYSNDRRHSIQYFILETIRALNEIFRPSIVRAVAFSAGDEIQGLFRDPGAAYLYYRLFALLVAPVRVRTGIGVGSWDLQISGEGTTVQDGKAYHRAREAIQAVDQTDMYDLLLNSGKDCDRVINTLIGTCSAMTEIMSEYQKDLMLLTEVFSPLVVPDTFEPLALSEIFRLLARREELYETLREDAADRRQPITRPFLIQPAKYINPVDLTKQKPDFFTTGGRQRGIPTRIASCMGVTRQSVEKSMKAANVYGVRNLSISALQCMYDWLGEKPIQTEEEMP